MLTIRPALPADCAALAQVQVNNYRTAYAGLFPPEYLAHFNLAEQEQDWLTLLAERPEEFRGNLLIA